MGKESDGRPLVVVVASPGTQLFELGVACEVFGRDRSDLTPNWYRFALVATEPDTTVGFGMSVPRGRGLGALAQAHTIVVPACANLHDGAPPVLISALRRAHARGARIASLCSGAFVLAEAGLLDGRKATCHWMHADELAARHPRTAIDPNVLYVHDDVWTSAGNGASLDLCLELVRHDHGAAVANEVGRRIVIAPHREGGQAQYIRSRPEPRGSDDSDIQHWARKHLADVTVAALADHARVSTRTLNRRFYARTGLSPQEWLQRERLHAAQELLEATELTVDSVAARVGLGTATNLRGHFAVAFGTTPGAYRRTFNSGAPRRVATQ